MLNIIQNTIGAIRRVGESVVRAGLKMWLPFTKAEPLGENLVVNGDFSDGTTGWVGQNANISVVGGELEVTSTVGYGKSVQNITTVVGKRYVLFAKVTAGTTTARLEIYSSPTSGSVGQSVSSGSQQVSLSFVAAATTIQVQLKCQSASLGTAYFDNISVEEYAQETPDISGNDNNAILKTGKALVFDGNDSVETSFPSSKTIKTIAFWIYPTHSAQFETLFNLGITNIPVSPLGDRVIQLNHLTISNKSNYPLNFDVYIDGVYRGETTYNGDNPTLSLNQWQRVVFVNSNGTSTVNDTFDVAYTGSGSHGRFKMSDLQIYGAEFTTDDIAYDYANPQSLVTDNASSNVTLNDLHAWWHMSEGSGTIAFDSAPLLGVDVVPNGDFSTDNISAISGGGTRSVENNKLKIQEDGLGYSQCIYLGLLDTAKIYKVTFDLTIGTGSYSIYNTIDGVQSLTDGSGSYTAYLTNTTQLYIGSNGVGDVWYLDNITAKEVYNIDGETYDGSALGATYDDAQERIPQLGMMNWSKGSNLIEYSEDFSNSYWAKGSVTLESGYLAPDGTLSAYKVTADEGYANALRLFSGVGSYYRSIWAKTTSGTGTVSLMTRFDSTGSIFTITNEWQRFTINSADSFPDYFYVVDFRGGNLDEVILWGAQLENSDSASAYRRTDGTAVTDATLISSATDSQKDILGNAVRVKGSGFNLDGTGYAEVLDDNDFDIPACNNVDEGGFTLAAWVKAKYINKTSSINVASTLGGDVTQPATGGIVSFNTNKLGAYINAAQLQADSTFIEGNWYYVVLTRADNGICKLYIDTNAQSDTDYTLSSITNTSNKMVGRDSLAYQRFYEERIDDVKFYDRELSSDEIEQNYNATKSGHNN